MMTPEQVGYVYGLAFVNDTKTEGEKRVVAEQRDYFLRWLKEYRVNVMSEVLARVNSLYETPEEGETPVDIDLRVNRNIGRMDVAAEIITMIEDERSE